MDLHVYILHMCTTHNHSLSPFSHQLLSVQSTSPKVRLEYHVVDKLCHTCLTFFSFHGILIENLCFFVLMVLISTLPWYLFRAKILAYLLSSYCVLIELISTFSRLFSLFSIK